MAEHQIMNTDAMQAANEQTEAFSDEFDSDSGALETTRNPATTTYYHVTISRSVAEGPGMEQIKQDLLATLHQLEPDLYVQEWMAVPGFDCGISKTAVNRGAFPVKHSTHPRFWNARFEGLFVAEAAVITSLQVAEPQIQSGRAAKRQK